MINLMNPEVTMSSREVAELTGKEHKNVKRDIEAMLSDLKEDTLRFERIYFDTMNRQQTEYNLDRRHVDCLLTGYSAMLRMKVIDRWQDLESKNAAKLPGNYIEALEALIESEKQKAIMAPKADVYDLIIDRNNLYNATQVAQKFGQSAVWMNKQLSEFKVYNRTVKRGKAFQQWFVDAGYGIMRERESGHSQPMFFAEGEMWIIKKLTEEGLI